MKSSKKIDVSKASLVSLKAELSRKQDEVNKAKIQGTFIQAVPRPKKQTIWTKKNPGVSDRDEKDLEEQAEDEDIFKKSRAVLEAKSQLYDKLSQASTTDDNRFLVDFQQKAAAEEENEVHASDEYDSPSDPEEDWVDYVDCLGRTRRCLKKDLDYIKQKDEELFRSLGGFEEKQKESEVSSETTAQAEGEPEMLSADMRREMMRQKWEQQEEQLRNKTDIHYQDILFDEARSHGVGYYGFSQDEALRRTQQEALGKLRQETQREQEASKDVKERRRLQLEARLKAARRRKRERMGLPPEEEEPEVKETPEEEQKSEPRPRTPEPEPPKIPQKPPKVRPWDLGKEGVKDVMSQEEWVQKKRTERPQEFAPPSSYQPDFMPASEQPTVRRPTLFFSSKKQSPVPISDDCEVPQHKVQKLESTSTTMSHHSAPSGAWMQRNMQWRDTDISPPGVSDYDTPCSSSVARLHEDVRNKGTEIPPPPTFDYYGPPSSASRQNTMTASNLESSISAGLKYLRKQAEEREKKQEKGLLDIV